MSDTPSWQVMSQLLVYTTWISRTLDVTPECTRDSWMYTWLLNVHAAFFDITEESTWVHHSWWLWLASDVISFHTYLMLTFIANFVFKSKMHHHRWHRLTAIRGGWQWERVTFLQGHATSAKWSIVRAHDPDAGGEPRTATTDFPGPVSESTNGSKLACNLAEGRIRRI